MAAPEAKPSKLHQRLQVAIDEKRFYEAHQLYKTIYFRCMTRKNYDEALNYLISGSKFFLANEQWESGIELASLVLEVYKKSKTTISEVELNQLCALLSSMCPGEERSEFITKSVSFLHDHKSLLASFNEYLACILWQEGSFTEARFHMMLSFNGFATGCFLIALHQRYGLRSEIDLFITQAVLQFLCMRQLPVASLTFYTYVRGHPALEPGPPFIHFPLLNFVWFLIRAITYENGLNVFTVLCDKYNSQINRDVSYSKYLDKIGQLYFGVPQPRNMTNNFLNNILQLFNGDADITEAFASLDGGDGASNVRNNHSITSEAASFDDVE